MSLVTGIITAPRKIQYIDRSLETYFAQELPKPHVFCEPNSERFYYRNQVHLHVNAQRLSCHYNWLNAAKFIIENTTSTHVLMCEDDVSWPINGFKLALDSESSVLSFYTAIVNATKDTSGWARSAGLERWGLCGALAILFPRDILIKVVEHKEMNQPDLVHLDTHIGVALSDLKIPILQHHPSIVTHIGEVSTFPVRQDYVKARVCYADSQMSITR